MAKFCSSCGKSLDDNAQFCDGCGATQGAATAGAAPAGAAPTDVQQQAAYQQPVQQAPVAEGSYDPQDIEKNKVMAALAYLLFFLPLVACPDSKFGRFHANQGLLVLIGSIGGGIAIAILSAILTLISWRLFVISTLLYTVFYIAITVLVVLGIINAVNGKAKPLPIIGKIKIIK